MLRINQQIAGHAAERIEAHWVSETAKSIHAAYSDYFHALGATPDDLVPLCTNVLDYAAVFDIESRRDVYRVILAAVVLGPFFWQDPRMRGLAARTVENPDVHVTRRALDLLDGMEDWLAAYWQDDSTHVFGQRLCEAVGMGRGPDALRTVLPQQWRLFPETDNQHFADAVLGTVSPGVLPSPPQRLAHLALSCVLGFGWQKDAQFTRFVEVLRGGSERAELAGALRPLCARVFAPPPAPATDG